MVCNYVQIVHNLAGLAEKLGFTVQSRYKISLKSTKMRKNRQKRPIKNAPEKRRFVLFIS